MSIKNGLVSLLVIILCACTQESQNNMASYSAEVNKVFSDVKKGDLSQTVSLVRHGEGVIQYVEPFLHDKNEAVKIEAVALLDVIGGETAANALVGVLVDQSEEIRERAARSLYKYLIKNTAQINLGSKPAESAKLGKPGAAVLLLLGYSVASPATSNEILKKSLTDERLVKLYQYSPMVPAWLPAMVSLSRLGDVQARLSLHSEIDKGNIDTLDFLLQTIESIDAPEILYALAIKTLTDEREISGGVPEGAQPSRRVADLAVDAFVERLEFEPVFEITPSRRYNKSDIHKILNLIRDAIPQ